MPESEMPTYLFPLVILLSLGLLMTGIGMILNLRILGRLGRLEKAISQSSKSRGVRETPEAEPSSAETSQGGAFETFLSEDPARLRLSKAEQFAAYRQWRDDKGLNWSNS